MLKMKPLYPVLVLAACGLGGCGKKQVATPKAASDPPPVEATVARVEARPFSATVAITGTLISRTQVDVKAETTGRVVRFDKEEGDAVRAGDPLVWVDERNYKLAVEQAQSAVGVAEAALEKARVLEEHSRSEHERARNLVASGGITDKDLKSAAVAEKDSMAQVGLAKAQLAQSRSMLDQANKRLGDTVVKAPVSGVIQRKFVNAGAYVEPPTAVFSLVDNSRLELESLVATAELAPVRPGQKVVFRVNSYPDVDFDGVVLDINPAVDADSRSAKVRIRATGGGRLKAGMFAQGEILTGVASQAIVIPAGAVYRDDRAAKDSYVFVVENGKAARRAVRIGREKDGKLEIVKGLAAGDVLITTQSIELAPGVRVKTAANGGGK